MNQSNIENNGINGTGSIGKKRGFSCLLTKSSQRVKTELDNGEHDCNEKLFKSNPGLRGYIKRIYAIWKEGPFGLSEQKLTGQARVMGTSGDQETNRK